MGIFTQEKRIALFGEDPVGEVVIPSGYTSIGEKAFYNCKNLTSVNLPEGLTSIKRYTFCGCNVLTSINLPDSITSISNEAFSACTSLASIDLPEGLTSIGNGAFYCCYVLSTINYAGTMAQWAAVTKGGSWKVSVPATVVHCLDGDVNI